ncbi:MAG: DUF6142 family protein [Herbinix sp.]|nr:DUF6142 family protein [Herbinix sp.]
MMLFRRNKEMIHFSGRRHTKMGISSVIIGVFVILVFLTISVISGLAKGKGGFLLGVIGLLLFFLSVFGFVLAYKSFKKKDIFYRFPVIGIILNGLMTLLFIVIYLLGI